MNYLIPPLRKIIVRERWTAWLLFVWFWWDRLDRAGMERQLDWTGLDWVFWVLALLSDGIGAAELRSCLRGTFLSFIQAGVVADGSVPAGGGMGERECGGHFTFSISIRAGKKKVTR